ncbi:hypothetical protein A9Z40_08205 [Microbacterium arborescens]|uniref:Uncharacterized protein n=1 Tax=Microbacterium arborescens TaxID=33883 RepID=A0ABX2WGW3_9MICO|nr:hypothetical protein [Microbacterium arborescens]OAZ39793.1 hypothetical protein A9Z40_08205 [Microbacterium arborescens]
MNALGESMRTRLSVALSALVVGLMVAIGVPSAARAADPSTDPAVAASLTELRLVSPSAIQTGQSVSLAWKVADKPATEVHAYFRDRVGRSFTMRENLQYSPEYSGVLSGRIPSEFVSGELTFTAFSVSSKPSNSVTYYPDYTSPSPSGISFRPYQVEAAGLSPTLTRSTQFATTGTPSIVGDATVGSTLTAKIGTWDPAPVDFFDRGYTWRRDGVNLNIDYYTNTYQLTPEDLGKTITVDVRVGASDVGIEPVTKTSAGLVVGLGQQVGGLPSIGGTPRVGQTLTAKLGAWAHADSTFTYQWQRDGQPIIGATEKAYTLSADDANRAITVRVSASRPAYQDAVRESLSVQVALATFSKATAPTIAGTPKVGATLVAKTGTWGTSNVVFAYQWFWNGRPIPGATEKTYTVRAVDAGRNLHVQVVGSAPGFADRATESAVVVPTKR